MAPTSSSKSKEIKSFQQLYIELKNEISKSNQEIKEELKGMRNDNEIIIGKIINLENENSALKTQHIELVQSNKMLISQVSKLIRDSKLNNLIIYKLEDTKEFNNNLFDNVITLLSSIENFCKDNIVDVYRLGRKLGNRPTVVKLHNKKMKTELFKKIIQSKLPIKIDNDMTDEERQKINNIRKLNYTLKNKGIDSKIKGDKISINGKLYTSTQTYNKYKDILEDAVPSKAAAMSSPEELRENFATPKTSQVPVKIPRVTTRSGASKNPVMINFLGKGKKLTLPLMEDIE